MKVLKQDECFWCNGKPMRCCFCGKEIPCMYCAGKNYFTMVRELPEHVCEDRPKGDPGMETTILPPKPREPISLKFRRLIRGSNKIQ